MSEEHHFVPQPEKFGLTKEQVCRIEERIAQIEAKNAVRRRHTYHITKLPGYVFGGTIYVVMVPMGLASLVAMVFGGKIEEEILMLVKIWTLVKIAKW